MGAIGSRLLGKKQIKFFAGKDYLTAVSEGEEVVWTNFEQTHEHEKSFRYDVPPVSGLADAHQTTKPAASNTLRRKSALDETTSGKDTRRPSGTVVRRPSANVGENSTGGSRRPSGNVETSNDGPTVELMAKSATPPKSSESSILKSSKEGSNNKTVTLAVDALSTGSAPDSATTKIVTGPDGYQRRKSVAMLQREATMRDLVVPVVPVLSNTAEEERDLSIFSLNLLSDFQLTNSVANSSDGRYKHAVEAAKWEARLSQFKDLFTRHQGTDVFALQEVDFFRYRDDLVPLMNLLGYAGCHQWDEDFAKKGQPNHPFGLATFWKRDRFRETFKEARSRTLIVGLSYSHRPLPQSEGTGADGKQKKKQGKKAKGSADWFIVNVHLEADPKKESKRLAQLTSALFNLSVHTKINPLTARVVVLGDFNSLREDSPFQWLLANESSKQPTSGNNDAREGEKVAPKGTYDSDALTSKKHEGNNQTTAKNGGEGEEDDEETNGKLAHAFKFGDSYGVPTSDDTVRTTSTYADPFAEGRVDHLLFTSDTCSVVAVLAVPPLTEETKRFGIFGPSYPSDHYPVGCLLRASDPSFPAEQEDDENDAADPNICPLTEGQMRVLEFLEQGAPKRSGKGKPTPQELAAIKTHTERVNAFCSHLTKNQKAWVAKWRKKYKPKEEENALDNSRPVERLTRSKSVFASPLRSSPFETIGLSDLLEGKWASAKLKKTVSGSSLNSPDIAVEVDTEPAKVKSPSPPQTIPSSSTSSSSSPKVVKRRQTVHGKKTAFGDL